MSENSDVKDDVIRKMLRDPPKVRGRFGEKLVSRATDMFRRAAKSAHDLNLAVPEATVELKSATAALEGLPEKRMTSILKHASEELALLVFDATLMDALIEQQTLGEVLSASRVDRPVTDIDRSLSEPFQRALMAQLGKLATEGKPFKLLSGYQIDRMETDPVRLALDLISPNYEVLSLTLDLGPGLKSASAQLWLPFGELGAEPAPKVGPNNFDLIGLLGDVEIPLTVTLPALKISVRKLMRLAPDDTIGFDMGILRNADVADAKGTILTKAHLGQLNGVRAIRLDTPVAFEETDKMLPGSEFEAAGFPEPAGLEPPMEAAPLPDDLDSEMPVREDGPDPLNSDLTDLGNGELPDLDALAMGEDGADHDLPLPN